MAWWAGRKPLCAALAVGVGAMVFRARALFFAIMLLLVAVPSVNSNPISVGLSPIYGKRLVQAVGRIAAAKPGERWLVYGDLTVPEIVRAAGADVFDGVRWPPEVKAMRMLDPTGASAFVWDRFAHIEALPERSGPVVFTLDQTDWYTMKVSPQNPALAAAHVALFVAPAGTQDMFPRPTFRQLTATPLNGYLIFERVSGQGSAVRGLRDVGTTRSYGQKRPPRARPFSGAIISTRCERRGSQT